MADDEATVRGARTPTKKAAAKKAAPRKAAATKAVAKQAVAKKAAPRKAVAKKAAARSASPKPEAADPNARVRAILRAAAATVAARDGGAGAAPRRGAPAPTAPFAQETGEPVVPVTTVLVAPLPGAGGPRVEPDVDVAPGPAAEDKAGWEEAEWAPPEVLEAPVVPAVAAPAPAPASPEPPAWAPPAAAAAPAAGAPKKRRRGLLVLLVLLVLAVVAVGGVLLALAGDEGVDYSKLKVGDCFDSSSSNEVRGVKVISCAKPHNSEIFFLVTHPAAKGDVYPGKDQLVQFAADSCLGQPLADYLGIPLEQSKLKDFEIVPQESAWKDGRRLLVCGIDTGTDGKISGSVKGARR